MKTKIYILSLIAIFGWGCSKKTETSPEKPKYDVTFSVSGIESSTDKLSPSPAFKRQSLAATPSPGYIVPRIDLYIYNSEGFLVAQVSDPLSTDEIIIEGLEIGNHTAIVVGHWGINTVELSSLATARIEQFRHDYAGEVYLDKVSFDVQNIESNLVKLILQRKVGLLNVDITDNAPHDVAFVRATLHSMASEYYFDSFMAMNNNYSPVFNYEDMHGPKGFGGYFMVPNNSDSYNTSVLLEVFGTNGNHLKSKLVSDVTVGTNIKTTIRGKLFEPNAHGFTIEIDTEWNGENTIDF